jgi:hypothetical protein
LQSHLNTKKVGPVSGSVETRPSGFLGLGQYSCSRQFVQQAIQNSVVTEFKRLGSSVEGISTDALLPGWATNVGTVGASVDDVSTLSLLGRVLSTLGSATNALSPGMVRVRWMI